MIGSKVGLPPCISFLILLKATLSTAHYILLVGEPASQLGIMFSSHDTEAIIPSITALWVSFRPSVRLMVVLSWLLDSAGAHHRRQLGSKGGCGDGMNELDYAPLAEPACPRMGFYWKTDFVRYGVKTPVTNKIKKLT